jgi:hypothetical protein
MRRELEDAMARGPVGLVTAAWAPEEFDTGSRVEFVLERHRHGRVHPIGPAARSLVLGPLRAPAEAEGLGHRLVDDLRTLDLLDDEDQTPQSSWVVAVVTSRSGDDAETLERYLNHALYEGWLYGPNQLSVFDDEDRQVLASTSSGL